MSLLTRYLFKQNLFLMFTVLSVGVGIYLLADLFDRLDDFLEAGLGASVIITYFVVKLPLIISQILPAVFLLACTIQLCIMVRSRELVALQAGGFSFARLAVFFVLFGVLWGSLQLVFSQLLGVQGEQISSKIWKEQVRGNAPRHARLEKLWFTEGQYIIYVNSLSPDKMQAESLRVYELSDSGRSINRIFHARTASTLPEQWDLQGVSVMVPGEYTVTKMETFRLPFKQDVRDFVIIDPRISPQRLPIWKLHNAIQALSDSGSNVEVLKTAFHMKLAYAGSVVVMGLLALSLVLWRDNPFVAIGGGLLATFVFYAIFTVGGSLGENGLMPPIMGAWGANILFGMLTFLRIFWYVRPRRTSRTV